MEELHLNTGDLIAIQNGTPWHDTLGEPIQAHGGGILYDEASLTYYWYGEDLTEPNLPGKGFAPAVGVRCYSSQDLMNWHDEGIVLPVFNNPQLADGTEGSDELPLYLSETDEAYQNSPLPAFSMTVADPVPENGSQKAPADSLCRTHSPEQIAELNALYENLPYPAKREIYLCFNWNQVLERPRVIYNAGTQQYVMWWRQDGGKLGESLPLKGGVAVSSAPLGPFRFLWTGPLPNRGDGTQAQENQRDLSLFLGVDQKAYLVYATSESKPTAIVLQLNESYTAPAANENGDCAEGLHWKRIRSGHCRSPVIFQEDGIYYMLASGDASDGASDADSLAYYTSANGIFGDWTERGTPFEEADGRRSAQSQCAFALPYRDKMGQRVPGKYILLCDRWDPQNLGDSRYIWLPLSLNTAAQTLRLRYYNQWTTQELLELEASQEAALSIPVPTLAVTAFGENTFAAMEVAAIPPKAKPLQEDGTGDSKALRFLPLILLGAAACTAGIVVLIKLFLLP